MLAKFGQPFAFRESGVLNPFLANVPILYHLKTPENLWFSGVFREYKMRTLARNGLIGKLYHCKYPSTVIFRILNPD